METLLSNRAISMSEFKKNPAAVLRAAQGQPVAVLNHNRVGFYLLEPQVYEALLRRLGHLEPPGPGHSGVAPTGEPTGKPVNDLLSQAKADGL